MIMYQQIRNLILRIERNHWLTIIKRALTMLIPFIVAGGCSCALLNFPNSTYQSALQGDFHILKVFLQTIYTGTFGLFSLALLISLSVSYAMERRCTLDHMIIHVLVTVGSYGAFLHIGGSEFSIDDIGVKGCFWAFFVAILSSILFSRLKKVRFLSLDEMTIGMEGCCANAIQTILPCLLVIGFFSLLIQILYQLTGTYNMQTFLSNWLCDLFGSIHHEFLSGLLYTFLVHFLWFFGFHGSHILESVAQEFFYIQPDHIFNKSTFDTFVVMGGCGTTICVLLLVLIFFRYTASHSIGKTAIPMVIFNLNEVLTFGLPIILNPLLFIPFMLTPILCYTITYLAIFTHFIPQITCELTWTTPILYSGYLATGSYRGMLVQLVCILLGMALYYPFLRLHHRMQAKLAKERFAELVNEFRTYEELNETPNFLMQGDQSGMISRMLLHDLKYAIANRELFLLFQPQVDQTKHCMGAEALIRWNHPIYGFIYPPFIIYLAKEGNILPDLEALLFDMAGDAIAKTSEATDSDFKISVNITAKSLLWDIESCISDCLHKYQIPANRLWLEITEQDMLANSNLVTEKLNRLHAVGHTLLIDDFGMGHTSLIYLQSNYFNIVKLDGSLVKNMLASNTNQKIIHSIVSLGQDLDIDVIAEYVETEEQQKMLEDLGCLKYQGYLYSKPVSLEEFIQYLKTYNNEH